MIAIVIRIAVVAVCVGLTHSGIIGAFEARRRAKHFSDRKNATMAGVALYLDPNLILRSGTYENSALLEAALSDINRMIINTIAPEDISKRLSVVSRFLDVIVVNLKSDHKQSKMDLDRLEFLESELIDLEGKLICDARSDLYRDQLMTLVGLRDKVMEIVKHA